MSRIKINLPQKQIASFDIPVRITDINYGNHLGNHAIVEIIHEARMKLVHQQGYTELNIEGVGLIMGDLAIEFKGESFYGDVMKVNLYADEISKISFNLYYELTCKRNDADVLIAKAKTGMIGFDYAIKKVAPLPQQLLNILNS